MIISNLTLSDLEGYILVQGHEIIVWFGQVSRYARVREDSCYLAKWNLAKYVDRFGLCVCLLLGEIIISPSMLVGLVCLWVCWFVGLLLGQIKFGQVCWSVPFVCLSVCLFVCPSVCTLEPRVLTRLTLKLYHRHLGSRVRNDDLLGEIGPRSRSRSHKRSKTHFRP